MILKLLTTLRLFALSIWVGKTVFFVSVFAPTVFKVLERPEAANLQANIFPKYFGLGVITTALVLLMSLLINKLIPKSRVFGLTFWLPLIACALYSVLLWHLTPAILKLQPEVILLPKDSTDSVVLEFAKIHSMSTFLNSSAFLIGIVILFLI